MDVLPCRIRSLKVKSQRQSEIFPLHTEKSQKNALGIYYAFFTTPFVKFVKDKLSQLIFIVLHCRICTLPSAVGPMIEEYLIFVFFCGMILSEYQQYKTSPLKYFKDMWNYLDIITLIVYILILILRMVTIARGGDPYHNRLLEVVNYLYGVNTLFLILRFSSILERSSLVGPLQLALFRMCVDLFIILIQFCFVICAFSVAITKSYIADVSYRIPSHTDQSAEIATKGEHHSLIKTSGQLIWSLFGLTSLQELEADTRETTDVVLVLFCIFLILSVVMLVNMLVALLTTTYDQASSNADVEWKFARAVIENQYRGLHPVVVPFNLLSVPGTYFLLGGKEDARKAEAKDVKESCKSYYQERLFPVITERYEKKYGGSFPLSVEEKIDVLMDKLKVLSSAEIVPEDHAEELGATCTGKLAADGKSTGAPLAETEDLESTTTSPPPSTNVVRISCAQ